MTENVTNCLFLKVNMKFGRAMRRAVLEKVQNEADLLFITIGYDSYPGRFPRKVQNGKADLQNGMGCLQNGKALLQK